MIIVSNEERRGGFKVYPSLAVTAREEISMDMVPHSYSDILRACLCCVAVAERSGRKKWQSGSDDAFLGRDDQLR